MPVRPLWFVFLSSVLFANPANLAIQARAQNSPQSVALPRITSAIDESALVTLIGNTHPLAQSKFDVGPAPVSMPANRMLLVLSRSTQQQADLETWLQSLQDVNSPNFHKFLNPDEFGKRFGIADPDLQTVQTWLTCNGFTIAKVTRGRTAIEFSGTAGQVQTAFHTSLHAYMIDGKRYYANATDPQIPSALSPVVAGFAALNGFRPKAQYVRGPSGLYNAANHTIEPTYTVGDSSSGYYIYLGPADVATIYDTPTALNPNRTGTAYDGTGVTIGIAGDSNINLTQNANYRATFGLSPKATKVVVDGLDPGENNDAVEAYLDTQVAGGVAPNANVILYTASDTDYQSGLFLAINRALDDNQADILNVSFGECEYVYGSSGNLFVSNLWEQAAAQGISVTVSSGDSGAAGCDNPDTETLAQYGLAVNAIGSTPYNISVGGTDYDALGANFPASFTSYVDITNTLANHRSALKYIPEEPWNDSTYPNTSLSVNKPLQALTGNSNDNNIAAGGGGISYIYSTPAWQSTFATGTGRNLPDVSFLAGNGFYGALWGICTDSDPAGEADCAAGATANNFYLTGIGGTSAAAPVFAGMLALVMQKTGARLGQADYALYDLARTKYSTVFHDVSVGDNSVNCIHNTANCAVNSDGYYFLTGYDAKVGYDQASGLGSVDAAKLLSNWSSASFTATASSLELNGATSPLSITHGQSVAVSATVTGSGGTPTGSVALVDSLSPANQPNSEGIQDFTLASGVASGTTTELPGGSYHVTAHYGGSTTYAQSDSNAIAVTVAPETSTTTLQVKGYYDPSTGKPASTPYYGYIFLLDAQPYGNSASAAKPDGAATGNITFNTGSTALGSAAIASSGIAELQTSLLPAGTSLLTASFPGDASFGASNSAAVSFTVSQAATALTMITPSTTVGGGSPVTFTVSITADSAGAAPTGTVTFQNGSTVLATIPVSGVSATSSTLACGSAIFTTTALPIGIDSITSSYSGDSNYSQSASSATAIRILPAESTVTVTPSAPSIIENQPLQVSVAVAGAQGLPAPTGTILLSMSQTGAQTATLVNGGVSFTLPANTLPLGQQSISATYSGDANYLASSGQASITVISSGTVLPTVTIVPPPGVAPFPVSVTVNITGPPGDATPTGSVLLESPEVNASQPLVNGSATFTFSNNLPGGTSQLTAIYLGDSTYTSGTGTATVDVLTYPTLTVFPPSATVVVDQPLGLTVYLNYQTHAPMPTGTITLSSGSYTSATVAINSASASFTIPANTLPLGYDAVTVSYSGDSNYAAATIQYSVDETPIPVPGFTVAGTQISVSPGATSGNASTIALTPTNGFTGTVSLTAGITSSPTGAQYLPTVNFGSSSPVSIPGTTAETATLTVSTTAATSAAMAYPKKPGSSWYATGGATLACLLLIGLPGRERRRRAMLGMLLLFVALFGGVFACGGGGGGGGGGTGIAGTTPGTYTITVTGTSGTTTASGTVTLIVQ